MVVVVVVGAGRKECQQLVLGLAGEGAVLVPEKLLTVS